MNEIKRYRKHWRAARDAAAGQRVERAWRNGWRVTRHAGLPRRRPSGGARYRARFTTHFITTTPGITLPHTYLFSRALPVRGATRSYTHARVCHLVDALILPTLHHYLRRGLRCDRLLAQWRITLHAPAGTRLMSDILRTDIFSRTHTLSAQNADRNHHARTRTAHATLRWRHDRILLRRGRHARHHRYRACTVLPLPLSINRRAYCSLRMIIARQHARDIFLRGQASCTRTPLRTAHRRLSRLRC